MSTQTVTEIIEPLIVKQEECETNIEEKHIVIPCKYFHTINGCRKGTKCWFSHDEHDRAEKKSRKIKQNQKRKVQR